MIQSDTLQQYLHELPHKYEAVNTPDIDAASEASQTSDVDLVSQEFYQPSNNVNMNLPSPAQILALVLPRKLDG